MQLHVTINGRSIVKLGKAPKQYSQADMEAILYDFAKMLITSGMPTGRNYQHMAKSFVDSYKDIRGLTDWAEAYDKKWAEQYDD